MNLLNRIKAYISHQAWIHEPKCNFTNQQFINAVHSAYGKNYWSKIIDAGLADIVQHRLFDYSGPPLYQIFDKYHYQKITDNLCKKKANARWVSDNGNLYFQNKKVKWLSVANLRSIAYFDFHHFGITKHGTLEDVIFSLKELKHSGVKVVRFYAASSKLPNGAPGTDYEFAIHRVRTIIQLLKQHGMEAWVVLTDNQSSGLHVHSQHKDGEGYTTHWYREGYKHDFLPFVQKLVSSIGDDVFCWEIANEYQINTDNSRINTNPSAKVAQEMHDFTKTVKEEIHRLSPNALVTPGFEALWNVYVHNTQMYRKTVELFLDRGFISPHTYIVPSKGIYGLGHNDRKTRDLIAMAKQVGVPVIIGEIGVSRPPDDTTSHAHLRAAYAALQRLGVKGAAIWGYMPSHNDIGWADPEGWTRALHSDYDAIREILQNYPTEFYNNFE